MKKIVEAVSFIKNRAIGVVDRAKRVYSGRIGKMMLCCDVMAVCTVLDMLSGNLLLSLILLPATVAAYVYTLKQIEKIDEDNHPR